MPEGDTIHRTARTLERVLAGHAIREAPTGPNVRADGLPGLSVVRVEARGKNLLIHFEDQRVLYTHMRMSGSWHIYRRGERWRRPLRQLKIGLVTDAFQAVCFNAPVVELLTPFRLRQHRFLARLGPDLLADPPDLDEAVRRAGARPDTPIGEIVMAQDVACGIGNVYKSETLFLEGLDPFQPASRLDALRWKALFGRASDLMRSNMHGFPRTTRTVPGGDRYWVYGRGGEACFRCGEAVRMRRQGTAGRSTYHCPRCQAVLKHGSALQPR